MLVRRAIHIKVDHMIIEPNYPAHIQLLMVPRKEAIIIDPMGAVSDSDMQSFSDEFWYAHLID